MYYEVNKVVHSIFSMYSKIPMPQFKWNDDDMKYMLVFFPWIGAVIGLLLILGDIYTLIWSDGYLLCMHRRTHSDSGYGRLSHRWFYGYNGCVSFIQTAGEKLAILKDSHIGAFAVIMLAAYGLLFMGAFLR